VPRPRKTAKSDETSAKPEGSPTGAVGRPRKARAATASQAATGGRSRRSPSEGDDDGQVDGTSGEGHDDREDGEAPAQGGREEQEPESSAAERDEDEDHVGEPEVTEEVEVSDRDLPAPESAGSMARFDPMAAYLREVQRHPLLTAEQTHDIAVKFVQTQDPALAAQLVTSNLRLVVKIAYEYRRAYKNIMDLVQEGNIGLMQAVKRYDPYRGVKLSSYAAWWIRAYILRFILNNWRLVKLGTTQAQRKLFFNLRKKKAELVAMGIEPTDAEIAKRLNVPESDVAEMDVRLTSNEKSLDAPVGDAEGRSIAKVDLVPSGWEGPESLMADGELQALLKDKLAQFRKTLSGKDKELAIFDERLVSDEPLTLQELGDRFGISRERVRQLEQRLTSKLRDYLRTEMGDAAAIS
jgi:RNA polymerase sigma-32 factor